MIDIEKSVLRNRFSERQVYALVLLSAKIGGNWAVSLFQMRLQHISTNFVLRPICFA